MPNVHVRTTLNDFDTLKRMFQAAGKDLRPLITQGIYREGPVCRAIMIMLEQTYGTEPAELDELYTMMLGHGVRVFQSHSHYTNLRSLLRNEPGMEELAEVADDEKFVSAAMKALDSVPNMKWGQFEGKTGKKFLVAVKRP